MKSMPWSAMLSDRNRRRLQKARLQYGFLGALGRLLIWPAMFVGWRLRDRLPFTRHRRRAGEEFDKEHGVHTVRDRSTEGAAEIDSEHWAAGTGYAASPPDTVRRSIRMLDIDHQEYVFIDLGSGKGRVFLVASEFPFQECLGVEYAPDLHEVAVKNIASFRSDKQRCMTLRAYCGDAAAFTLPASPLVLFFAHPFGGAVLDQFLQGVLRSLDETPRKMFVIYYDPICGEKFVEAGFREVGSHDLPRFHTFRNRRGKEFVIYENDVGS